MTPHKLRSARRGRPAADPVLKKVPVSYKLPAWLVDWLRGQDRPAAQLIEASLCQQHHLHPPERKTADAAE